MTNLSFSQAFNALKDGQKMQREGWNGKNQWVECQYPDESSKTTVPYLCLRNAQGDFVPWVPSQGDLFAYDWQEVES